MKNARDLVMAHAHRSMFATRSRMLGALMQRRWQSSAHLAALSAVLARQFGRYPPERALLAGLLQDIGVLPILNVLKHHEDQLTDEAQVFNAVERNAGPVGMVPLKHWHFDADMVEFARGRRAAAPSGLDLDAEHALGSLRRNRGPGGGRRPIRRRALLLY